MLENAHDVGICFMDDVVARRFNGHLMLLAHSPISASKDAHPEGLDLWALDMFRGMRRVYSGVRTCRWLLPNGLSLLGRISRLYGLLGWSSCPAGGNT